MPKLKHFEDLEAWRSARLLTREIYRLTSVPPFSKDFGLRDQITRAAVSVMSNIAEGFERDSDKAFLSFLSIAKGSVGEVRSQLFVALDLGYITRDQFEHVCELCLHVGKLIAGILQYLKKSLHAQ